MCKHLAPGAYRPVKEYNNVNEGSDTKIYYCVIIFNVVIASNTL